MADRQRIIQQILGPKGMCYASDPVTLDIRQQNVLNVAEVVSQQDSHGQLSISKGVQKIRTTTVCVGQQIT